MVTRYTGPRGENQRAIFRQLKRHPNVTRKIPETGPRRHAVFAMAERGLIDLVDGDRMYRIAQGRPAYTSSCRK